MTNVSKLDCMEWSGALSEGGYGQIRINGKTLYLHRVMWVAAHGEIPEGQMVRHKCDNRKCYRLDHLELGTAQDNSDDCTSRNRQAKGSDLPQAKLSELDVFEIFHSVARQKVLAKVFGVSQGTISHIKSGRTWKHVSTSTT